MFKAGCLVVGAGPAGSAAALLLARAGWGVTLVDRRPSIGQKICGECLSPPSRELLENLGAWSRIPKHFIQQLDGITLVGPLGSRCTLDFGPEGPFAISRPVLDQTLLSLAQEAGAEVQLGVTLVKIEEKDRQQGFLISSACGKRFEADFLIGADGRHSWIARSLGLARARSHSLQHSAVMGHFSGFKRSLRGVEMHVAPWGYVGLNPLPGGSVNVIAVMTPETLKNRLLGKGKSGLLSLLKDHTQGEYAPPHLKAAMLGASPASTETWTTSPLAWLPRNITANRCALLGDSAGFVDPFTGEGLYHALASARELVAQITQQGIESGLKNYNKWHKEKFGPEERFCLWLQRVLPYSRIADYTIRQLSRKPELKQILAETVADRLSTRKVLSPLYWGKLLWPSGNEAINKGSNEIMEYQ